MAQKYYAVQVGRQPGIYTSWDECQQQVKGFPKMKFKSFELLSQAEDYMKGIDFDGKNTIQQTSLKNPIKDKPDFVIETDEAWEKESILYSLPTNLIIYTDGSCLANTVNREPIAAPGGYAAVILDESGEKELYRISGGLQKTTNVRMELTAVKEALAFITADGKKRNIQLISDNKMIVDSVNKRWIEKWKKNGEKTSNKNNWIKSDGNTVKNQDLWKSIDRLKREHNIQFNHTYAHVGTKYNELCDQLAKKEANLQAGMIAYIEREKSQKNIKEETKTIKKENIPKKGIER